MTPEDKQLRVPIPDGNFFVLEEVAANLERLERLSRKHPVNVLVTGSQGCGKSSLVRQFAAVHGRPLATFQIGLLAEAGHLFGQQRLRGGETYFQSFLFPRAIQTPGCVVHLEELNRSETPYALNELYSVLSEDRSIWVDELGTVAVAPGVVFFATMNEGEEFTGADRLDAALRDRFYHLQLESLPEIVEEEVLQAKAEVSQETAKEILGVVGKLRANGHAGVNISVRHSLMVGELVAQGAPLREALVYSLQISRDALESILLALHVERGETEAADGRYGRYLPRTRAHGVEHR